MIDISLIILSLPTNGAVNILKVHSLDGTINAALISLYLLPARKCIVIVVKASHVCSAPLAYTFPTFHYTFHKFTSLDYLAKCYC